MALIKIKVSQLPIETNYEGSFALGINDSNNSARFSLGFIQDATLGIGQAIADATSAAAGANAATGNTIAATEDAELAAQEAREAAASVSPEQQEIWSHIVDWTLQNWGELGKAKIDFYKSDSIPSASAENDGVWFVKTEAGRFEYYVVSGGVVYKLDAITSEELETALEEKADKVHTHEIKDIDGLTEELSGKIPLTQKGSNNGVATLGVTGKIPNTQLPNAVFSVLEFPSFGAFPPTGEKDKIYIDAEQNAIFRWSPLGYEPLTSVDVDALSAFFVRFDESQSLSTGQKTTARNNIGAAADDAVVKLSGNQVISGAKGFSQAPASDTDAETATQLVRLSQVSSLIADSNADFIKEISITTPSIFSSSVEELEENERLINIEFIEQPQNYILASPINTTGIPSFRSLSSLDIPELSISKITNLQDVLDSKADYDTLDTEFVTISTTQTNISGFKSWTGQHTFGNVLIITSEEVLRKSSTPILNSNESTTVLAAVSDIALRPNGMYSFDNQLYIGQNLVSRSSSFWLGQSRAANDVFIKLGGDRGGNGYSYLDFVTDTVNAYSFRIISAPGENGPTEVIHKGIGDLKINTIDLAKIVFYTGGQFRGMVNEFGKWVFGGLSFDSGILNVDSGTPTGNAMQIHGAIRQTAVTGALVKADIFGVFSAAVDGVDYIKANQNIILSGAITGSGATSINTTLSDNIVTTNNLLNGNVTLGKLQAINSQTLLGRSSAGSGVVESLSIGSGLSISSGVLNTVATTLNNSQIGFGSASNTLTSSSNFTFLENRYARTWLGNSMLSFGSLVSSLHSFIQSNNGDLLLGSNSSYRVIIDTGIFRVNNLSGTGTRYVTVNTSGDLGFTSSISPAIPNNQIGYGISGVLGSSSNLSFVDSRYIQTTLGSSTLTLGSVNSSIHAFLGSSNGELWISSHSSYRVIIGPGNFAVSNLAGGGLRMATVDNNGTLGAQAIPSGGSTALSNTYIGYGISGVLGGSSNFRFIDNRYIQTALGSSILTMGSINSSVHTFIGSANGDLSLMSHSSYNVLVESNFRCSGSGFFQNGVTFRSDKRDKDCIEPIGNALFKIRNISGNSYLYNGIIKYGAIAQEVANVLPYAVENDSKADRLNLDYNALIALNIEAIKEVDTEVEKLKKRVQYLENKLGYAASTVN